MVDQEGRSDRSTELLTKPRQPPRMLFWSSVIDHLPLRFATWSRSQHGRDARLSRKNHTCGLSLTFHYLIGILANLADISNPFELRNRRSRNGLRHTNGNTLLR